MAADEKRAAGRERRVRRLPRPTDLRAGGARAREALIISGATLGGSWLLGALTVDDLSVPMSVVVLGVIAGLTYGLLAVGLVLVYRTSGVVNFAHGEVGTLAASLFGVWVANDAIGGFGLPYWLMLPAAMLVAAGANMAVETIAIRRLRNAPKVMSLVVTLGAAQFFLLISLAVNTEIRSGSLYPRPPWLPSFEVGALTVTPEYTAMLLLTPAAVIALAVFLSRSRYGVALRAAADNRDAAVLAAIPAGRMSSLAWGIAGATSAFAAVLQFPQKGFVIGGAALGPGLLVRALLAAVVARMTSLPVALGFGVVIGVVEQATSWNSTSAGTTELVLFLVLLGVLLFQRREPVRTRVRENWMNARPWPALPPEWRTLARIRHAGPATAAVSAVVFVAVGLTSNRVALAFTLVVAFTMIGLSIYVITGMGGELSLGQFAVAGVGAVVSVHVVDAWVRSIPLGVLAGATAGAAVSVLIGLPALRIRGLMLAVATMSFAVAAEAWLFAQPWTVGTGVQPARLVWLDEPIGSSRAYFLFTLPFLLAALWLVRNLAAGHYGRSLRALRDNEDGARAFGVPVTRRKLEAFGFAGFLAGGGGAVYAHGLPRLSVETFSASQSVTVAALALIGGLSVMVGPLFGALYLLALPALVELDSVGLAVSTLGWLLLLLYFPGGLAQAAQPLRNRFLAHLAHTEVGDRPQPPPPEQAIDVVNAASPRAASQSPRAVRASKDGVPLLSVRGVSKSYGGVSAVADVSFDVLAGETVGIIGPNGAGKTTLFELIGGFTPIDSGTVTFDGTDISRLAPERRAELGLIRSFQDARLFPTLTVREALELATGARAASGLWSSLAAWPTTVDRERLHTARADELMALMGLSAHRDHTISELSTGTRRIVDLAAIVALEPRLVLLDEPSSGVAQRETESLGGLLQQLKERLGATFVVIEHDMPLLQGMCNRLIAMETGRVIADGTPTMVTNHPEVVASYLGTSSIAVERSGATDPRTSSNGLVVGESPTVPPAVVRA